MFDNRVFWIEPVTTERFKTSHKALISPYVVVSYIGLYKTRKS
jgi:hypothetical protein